MTPIQLAIAVTRGWTRMYTWRLPAELAAERRREVDCDIWEMLHDEDGDGRFPGAVTMITRLVDGVADDVAWRVEQGPLDEQLLVRRAVAVVAAGTLVMALWSIPALFAGGMRNVNACAGQAPRPETAPDLRLELVRCTGAFFLARD